MLALAAARPLPAVAHSGPPYVVSANQAAGPYTVSLWADPDLGGGQIMVQVSAPVGAQPDVSIAARPLDGHVAEAVVAAERGGPYKSVGADTWVATLPFDTEGTWALTVQLSGAEGQGTLKAPVDVRPDGPTQDEVWLFVMPFALLVAAWLVGRLRHRSRAASGAPGSGQAGSDPTASPERHDEAPPD